MKLTGKLELIVYKDGGIRAVLKRFFNKKVYGKKFIEVRLPNELLSEIADKKAGETRRLAGVTLSVNEAYLNVTSKKIADVYRDVFEIAIVEACISEYYFVDNDEPKAEDKPKKTKKSSKKVEPKDSDLPF